MRNRKLYFAVGLCLVMLLSSCDILGNFRFSINNKTEQAVKVSFAPLAKINELYVVTKNNEIIGKISEKDTMIVIAPFESLFIESMYYQVGMSFPSKKDTPENNGVVPLWVCITSIVVGNDTIDSSEYARDKWTRSDHGRTSEYILDIGGVDDDL